MGSRCPSDAMPKQCTNGPAWDQKCLHRAMSSPTKVVMPIVEQFSAYTPSSPTRWTPFPFSTPRTGMLVAVTTEGRRTFTVHAFRRPSKPAASGNLFVKLMATISNKFAQLKALINGIKNSFTFFKNYGGYSCVFGCLFHSGRNSLQDEEDVLGK
ncbi:hypothetical protein Q3G72_025989 [Acer saccharum]|nr:hypothetical protein Q3G72_025989 [Acer saccharum]